MSSTDLKEMICDRCAKMLQVRKGDEHQQWGHIRYRRINGATTDRVGGEALPADICEECVNGFLKWWGRQP